MSRKFGLTVAAFSVLLSAVVAVSTTAEPAAANTTSGALRAVGGIGCDGNPPSGGPGGGTVSLSRIGDTVTVDISLSGASDPTYYIEIFKAAPGCFPDENGRIGGTLSTSGGSGSASFQFTVPLNWYNGTIDDSSSIVLVLDRNAGGGGDSYATNPIAIPSASPPPSSTTTTASSTTTTTASTTSTTMPDDPDGDGVFGADDVCPNEPGPASADGCPLHLGVIGEGSNGFAVATLVDRETACVSSVEILSNRSKTDLWTEISIGRNDGDAELVGPLRFLDGLLAPGGLTPATWEVCFRDINQAVEFRIDSTSLRAESAQFLEILLGSNFFSAAGVVNDIEAIHKAVQTFPTGARNAILGCFDGSQIFFQTCLATAILFHAQELAPYLKEVAGDLFIFEELGLVLQDATLFLQYVGRLVAEQSLTQVGRAVTRDFNSAARELQQTDRRLARAESQVGRFETQLESFLQEVQDLESSLGPDNIELQLAERDLQICRLDPGCFGTELREIRREVQRLSRDAIRLNRVTNVWIPNLNRRIAPLRESIQIFIASIEEIGDKVARLDRIKRVGVPFLESYLEIARTFSEKYDRAANNTESGNIFVVSCAYNDTRPACQ